MENDDDKKEDETQSDETDGEIDYNDRLTRRQRKERNRLGSVRIWLSPTHVRRESI